MVTLFFILPNQAAQRFDSRPDGRVGIVHHGIVQARFLSLLIGHRQKDQICLL